MKTKFKVDVRFIAFVFWRYLLVAIITSLLMVMFAFPFTGSFELAPMAVSLAFFGWAFLFPMTFMGAPYYDCENGKHWIYGDWNNGVFRCKKCGWNRSAKFKKKSRTIMVLDDE